jgi:hypothetical protein
LWRQSRAIEEILRGLTAGGHWPKFKDWAHAQLRPANHPGTAMPIQQIDAIMMQRFG